MIAVADTSGLLAVFNRAEPEHGAASAAASACGLLVVSPVTLTEVHQVASVRGGPLVADAILGTLVTWMRTTRLVIAETTARQLGLALGLRRRYGDLDLDLADVIAAAVAAEYRTDVVLTLDRRAFRAMRPLTGHPAFRLLPDDL